MDGGGDKLHPGDGYGGRRTAGLGSDMLLQGAGGLGRRGEYGGYGGHQTMTRGDIMGILPCIKVETVLPPLEYLVGSGPGILILSLDTVNIKFCSSISKG